MSSTCETCRFLVGVDCRRYPPQMILYPTDNQQPIFYAPGQAWPYVGAHSWCGEHQPKEPDHG